MGREGGREGGILHVEAFILAELECVASVLCYQPFVPHCFSRVRKMFEFEENSKSLIITFIIIIITPHFCINHQFLGIMRWEVGGGAG